MTLTVSTLIPSVHHGSSARVDLPRNDSRDGVLSYGRNPSYARREVRHWWLLIPSALAHFGRDALSLQWAGDARVHLLTEEQS